MNRIHYNSLILCVAAISLFALLCLYMPARWRGSGRRVITLTTSLRQEGCRDQFLIDELETIKLSVRNEVRLLEKERFELANDIISKKSQLTKLSLNLINTQKKLNAERDSFLQLSNRHKHQLKWNKPKSVSAVRSEPIYILSGVGRRLPSQYEGESLSGYSADVCGSAGCFDMNACSVLYEPGIYLIENEQPDRFASHVMESFSLNSPYQLLEEPESACFHLLVTTSPDTDRVVSDLQSRHIWHNTTQPILLIQLLYPDSAEHDPPSTPVPPRILLASPLSAFRPRHDIVIPPLFSHDFAMESWTELPLLFPLHRKHLLYFAGSFEGRTEAPFITQLEQLSSKLGGRVSINLDCTPSHPLNSSWGLCGDKESRIKQGRESVFSFIPAPPGRRGVGAAGLVRLSESLYTGSIPVVCAEEMWLPYSEVVQWDRAVLRVDPSRIRELHYLIRRISDEELLAYKQQGRFLWISYFSSAHHTLLTSITLLLSRFSLPPPSSPSYTPDILYPAGDTANRFHEVPWSWYPTGSQQTIRWNAPPGSHHSIHPTPWQHILTSSMQYLKGFPPSLSPLPPHVAAASGATGFDFQNFLLGNSPEEQFTVVILTYKRRELLRDSISRLVGLSFLHKVLVVWNDPDELEGLVIPDLHVPVLVVRGNGNSLNNRFLPYEQIETEAVLSLDDDLRLEHDEITFAFRVWRENRDRLVGFPARFHTWDVHSNQWMYNSNYACEVSLVLTGAAFLHKYYLHLYTAWLPASIRRVVDEFMNCEDIAMNFLVAHISRQPPIKVTSRLKFGCPKCTSLWEEQDHFRERSQCLNMFVDEFGYMPLLYTQFRADSMLYHTTYTSKSHLCYPDV